MENNKKVVPIAFAFDENLILPAEVAICSLLQNALPTTFYDIYILYGNNVDLSGFGAQRIKEQYPNCNITLRNVGDLFAGAYEIRGITNVTYYRLLIPTLIPEYDKIIYSDVDVIFRDDLSHVYQSTLFEDEYVAGVRALMHNISGYAEYYSEVLGLSPADVIYAGNIIVNSKKIREDNLVDVFCEMTKQKFRFQDMDIINIACKDRIKYLDPAFCVTTYFTEFAVNQIEILKAYWSMSSIMKAIDFGIVHYNGQKPWKGYCVNFDIWWEYYRKSPFFDAKFYFDFFYSRLNEYDLLPLWKRIKILIRYFVYGRKAM